MSPQKVSRKDHQPPKEAGVKLLLKGRIPSKKNSRNLFVRGGRLMNIPSKAYALWHTDALTQLDSYRGGIIDDVERVELFFYAPDRRSSDLTNKAESVMDLLVDKGVLEDDNWWLVSKIELNFMGVDKLDPRCEISIHRKRNHHEPRLQ